MATNIAEFADAGLHCIQIGGVSSGIFNGYGLLTAVDTTEMSGMRHIQGAVTAPTPTPGVNTVYARDDDRYHGAFDFDAQPSGFGMVFEASDLDLGAWIQKKALATIGVWDLLNSGNSNRKFQPGVILLTRQAQSYDVTADGDAGYDNLVILNTKFTRTRGDAAFQAVGQVTLNGVASPVKVTPWGALMSAIFTGDADGLTWEFWSQYVPTFGCVVSDGTVVALPLPYAPIDVASTKVYNCTTGAAITVSSVSVVGKTATISAAPASGILMLELFETTDL